MSITAGIREASLRQAIKKTILARLGNSIERAASLLDLDITFAEIAIVAEYIHGEFAHELNS